MTRSRRRTAALLVALGALGLTTSSAPAHAGAPTDRPAAPAASTAPAAWGGHDHAQHGHAGGHGADPDRARGLVFDGLETGRPDGHCVGSYQASMASGHTLCTHGPDPAPEGIDVTEERSVEDLAAGTAESSSTTASTGSVPCVGDGVSGNRVQVVYAVAADRTDRFASVAPMITSWAATVDRVFDASAAETGGTRHVRFVTNPDCSLAVAHVVLTATGDDNVANTANQLAAQGFNRPDRRYLILVDATVYCGIAYILNDDRPTQDNLNNGNTYAGYARVDSGCWGRANSLEAHELMHTMGGVQRSAPHGTSAYHCTDEYDRMCYADGSGEAMTYGCASSHEARFDCNHDDYFSTAPAPSSYLATHWNVANSSFLTQSTQSTTTAPAPPPPADTTAPPAPSNLSAQPADRKVTLSWSPSAASDVASYRVYRSGTLVGSTTTTSSAVTGLTNGVTYSFCVIAVDASGNASGSSPAVSATPVRTRTGTK